MDYLLKRQKRKDHANLISHSKQHEDIDEAKNRGHHNYLTPKGKPTYSGTGGSGESAPPENFDDVVKALKKKPKKRVWDPVSKSVKEVGESETPFLGEIDLKNLSFPKWLKRYGGEKYRPEKHYMRGPGPATRAKEADKPTNARGQKLDIDKRGWPPGTEKWSEDVVTELSDKLIGSYVAKSARQLGGAMHAIGREQAGGPPSKFKPRTAVKRQKGLNLVAKKLQTGPVDPPNNNVGGVQEAKQEQEHPMIGKLKKAVKEGGRKPVTFEDGKKAFIHPSAAQKALDAHEGLRTPQEKHMFAGMLHKSHISFRQAFSS